ncbi:MAG: hypothetical protein IKH26_04110 [Bacteroidaceae bacterium]|nr:hypothetical protein [Bacteroidaceae bacterium]
MKKLFAILAVMMLPMLVTAQETTDSLFKGKFKNAELNIQCQLNLYEEVIEVPGLELETCYGFLQGQINGCWMILKVKEIQGDAAVVRVVSEKGSDAQDLKLKVTEQGLEIQQTEGYIKGIQGRKYVKLPKSLLLNKQ